MEDSAPSEERVVIHTDGASIGNPGPGGYGIVIIDGEDRRELSGGYRLTTGNRMELIGPIKALEAASGRRHVTLHCASPYVVDAMEQGWARRWQANGWMRNRKARAANPDLWERLLNLCERHAVEFRLTRGDAGNPEQEHCYLLAWRAARQDLLLVDEGHESPSSVQPRLISATTRAPRQESAPDLPQTLNLLLLMDPDKAPVDDIAASAPERLRVTAAPGQAFADDAGLHPPSTGLWKGAAWTTDLSPAEREQLLREAHILVVTLPFPKRLLPRMTNLLWAQYLWAGISDMRYSDIWGSRVRVGSSRGHVETLPIAEMVIAAALYFAKELGLAARQTASGELSAAPYNLRLLAGKTMGVVGLGGIGLAVARLAKALGMRVIATRRSAFRRVERVGDVDILLPPSGLTKLLAESDYVALAPVLTDETIEMINAATLASMKDDAVLINVGRGELIDESALKDALRAGRLRGVYLDVYADEWSRPPDPELMSFSNVVMTPHNSGRVDVPSSFSVDILKENIRRFVAGEALINEVDWARGY